MRASSASLTRCAASGARSSHSNLHDLPRLQRHKTLARNLRLLKRRMQRDDRRVDRLVGELKGAVVMRQRLLRAAIGQRLHGVCRVHMLVSHEPARLIGADGKDRQPQWTMRLSDAAEMLALAVAGIADDVDLAWRRLQHKARPQRLVAVEQSAR